MFYKGVCFYWRLCNTRHIVILSLSFWSTHYQFPFTNWQLLSQNLRLLCPFLHLCRMFSSLMDKTVLCLLLFQFLLLLSVKVTFYCIICKLHSYIYTHCTNFTNRQLFYFLIVSLHERKISTIKVHYLIFHLVLPPKYFFNYYGQIGLWQPFGYIHFGLKEQLFTIHRSISS